MTTTQSKEIRYGVLFRSPDESNLDPEIRTVAKTKALHEMFDSLEIAEKKAAASVGLGMRVILFSEEWDGTIRNQKILRSWDATGKEKASGTPWADYPHNLYDQSGR